MKYILTHIFLLSIQSISSSSLCPNIPRVCANDTSILVCNDGVWSQVKCAEGEICKAFSESDIKCTPKNDSHGNSDNKSAKDTEDTQKNELISLSKKSFGNSLSNEYSKNMIKSDAYALAKRETQMGNSGKLNSGEHKEDIVPIETNREPLSAENKEPVSEKNTEESLSAENKEPVSVETTEESLSAENKEPVSAETTEEPELEDTKEEQQMEIDLDTPKQKVAKEDPHTVSSLEKPDQAHYAAAGAPAAMPQEKTMMMLVPDEQPEQAHYAAAGAPAAMPQEKAMMMLVPDEQPEQVQYVAAAGAPAAMPQEKTMMMLVPDEQPEQAHAPAAMPQEKTMMMLVPDEQPEQVQYVAAASAPAAMPQEKTMMMLVPDEQPEQAHYVAAASAPAAMPQEKTMMMLVPDEQPEQVQRQEYAMVEDHKVNNNNLLNLKKDGCCDHQDKKNTTISIELEIPA
ncbi:hypothetical protein BB561_006456 [Smittium simulii]|uniref:Carbohydrate-binding module family 19 domain-containing protein n=1 Tax=Smittium simulii TaxID=133385 RepID=A0A2T9Y455_9FUNG|nr:hypothetical protein BB561_006456 [Smittium simulii]